MVSLIVSKIRRIRSIAPLITCGSTRINRKCILIVGIFFLCPDTICCKRKWRHKTVTVFPFIPQTVCCLFHTINKQISGKLRSISRTAYTVKCLMCRIIDSLYCCTDILYRITVNQFFHIGSCKTPITVNCLISHCYINKVVTAASNRSYPVEVIKILKYCHQSGNSAFNRRLVNNSCLRQPILWKCRRIVRYHYCNWTTFCNVLSNPLSGKITLNFAIFLLPLRNNRKSFRSCRGFRRLCCITIRKLNFLYFRCFCFGLFFFATPAQNRSKYNCT